MKEDITQIVPKINALYSKYKFPEANVGIVSQNRYRNMYDDIPPLLMKAVKEKYRADAELFGYSIDDYGPLAQ